MKAKKSQEVIPLKIFEKAIKDYFSIKRLHFSFFRKDPHKTSLEFSQLPQRR